MGTRATAVDGQRQSDTSVRWTDPSVKASPPPRSRWHATTPKPYSYVPLSPTRPPDRSISRARKVQAPTQDAGPPAALRLSAAVFWAPQRLIVAVSPKFARWRRLNRNGAVPAAPAHAEPP